MSAAGTVEVEVDPGEVGFDADRLERIGTHLHRYVDDGRLPGTHVLVTRGGKIAYIDRYGMADMERSAPVVNDTVYRIYSMSKPITSIAAMQLYEQGHFQLKDPVSKWIPSFAGARVFAGGNADQFQTREPAREVSVHDLFTHCSGLTYDFHMANFVDEIYRKNGFNWGAPGNLEETCDALAGLPLLFDPGTEWNYSYSTDVLGRLVEVISGHSLDEYFAQHVLGPLDMTETSFQVTPEQADRFAANYRPGSQDMQAKLLDDPTKSTYLHPPKILSGGGGLVSTMHDYHRFTLALRNGGELDGNRVIGRKTLEYMATNHLPGGVDLTAFGRALFSEAAFDGVGFGLGFSVVIDPAKAEVLSQKGEFAWGGAASTAFWVDPVEDVTVVFLTQLLPSSTHPIRPELKALVYQALV
jgi:CubicO group peptidase (beta-lactamase class C family)